MYVKVHFNKNYPSPFADYCKESTELCLLSEVCSNAVVLQPAESIYNRN